MAMKAVGCLFGLALTQLAWAQTLGFEQPSKDELGFVRSCVADEVTCAYSRTMLLSDGRLRQAALAILDTSDPDLLSPYSAPGAMIWSQLFDCSTDSLENRHILFSNRSSWKDYAVRYGRAESALLAYDTESVPPADLDEVERSERIASIAHGLAQRIKYHWCLT